MVSSTRIILFTHTLRKGFIFMYTRQSADNCCPVTNKMWSDAMDRTNDVNRMCSNTLKDDDIMCCCCIAGLGTGCFAPGVSLVTWLLCCTLPPVGAAICTPVTGIIDCGIFSCEKISKACNKENTINGPETQVMVDDSRQYLFR